jgi:hypothetical protein
MGLVARGLGWPRAGPEIEQKLGLGRVGFQSVRAGPGLDQVKFPRVWSGWAEMGGSG